MALLMSGCALLEDEDETSRSTDCQIECEDCGKVTHRCIVTREIRVKSKKMEASK